MDGCNGACVARKAGLYRKRSRRLTVRLRRRGRKQSRQADPCHITCIVIQRKADEKCKKEKKIPSLWIFFILVKRNRFQAKRERPKLNMNIVSCFWPLARTPLSGLWVKGSLTFLRPKEACWPTSLCVLDGAFHCLSHESWMENN